MLTYRLLAPLPLALLTLALTACQQASGDASVQNPPMEQPVQASMSCEPVERVEVVHFHGTQQCVSCIAVGRLAKKTLEESFSSELASGKVIFRDINGELPENRDIVMRYQARGSSLFVNAVSEGRDRIEEDATVWRLYSNEEQYEEYFARKIKNLLSCAS